MYTVNAQSPPIDYGLEPTDVSGGKPSSASSVMHESEKLQARFSEVMLPPRIWGQVFRAICECNIH